MAEVEAVFKDKAFKKFLSGLDLSAKKIKGRHKDFVVLLSAITFQDIEDHFQKEQGPDRKWKSWSSSYKKFMNKIGKGGNNLLQDSGNLRQMNSPIEKGKNFRRISNGILWFNPAKTKGGFPYAAHHDAGKSDGQRPRTFMWLSKNAMKDISKQSLKFVLENK